MNQKPQLIATNHHNPLNVILNHSFITHPPGKLTLLHGFVKKSVLN